MKNIMALLVLVLAVLSTGCKKKNDEPPGLPKLKMMIEDVGNINDTTTYTYNADGTIHSVVDDGDLSVFSYSTGFVTKTSYSTAGSIDFIETYILNTKGLADSIVQVNTSGNISRYGLNYDGNDFLTEHYTYKADTIFSTIEYINDSKNIIAVQILNHQGLGLTYTANYGYFLNNENTIGNSNMGMSFLGKSSKNAYNSIATNFIVSSFMLFAYEYDRYGRIVNRKQYASAGSNVVQQDEFYYY